VRTPPVSAGAKARRSNVADAVDEASTIVSEQYDRAARQTGDVASAAGAGQALHFVIAVAPGGVQVAEAIDFRRAEKADVDAALLEQAHHLEHLAALGSFENIRWVAHGVEQLGRGRFANNSVFKKSDGAGRMGSPRHEEGQHGQAHPNEDHFAIANFARGGRHHKFAEGVGTRGDVSFGAMSQMSFARILQIRFGRSAAMFRIYRVF